MLGGAGGVFGCVCVCVSAFGGWFCGMFPKVAFAEGSEGMFLAARGGFLERVVQLLEDRFAVPRLSVTGRVGGASPSQAANLTH